MKEVTLNQLQMLIQNMINDLSVKKRELNSHATETILKNSDGSSEVMSFPYDFKKGLDEIKNLTETLITYRALLQECNNRTKINEVDTIASALIKLKEKRSLLNCLEDIFYYTKESKTRKTDNQYSNSYYIELIQANFDKESLEREINQLRDSIDSLESQVNDANTTTKVVLP